MRERLHSMRGRRWRHWPMGMTAALLVLLLGLSACNDNEAAWDTSADTVGTDEGDRSYAAELWGLSRDEAVTALDSMKYVLEKARSQAAVVDAGTIDGLTKQIDGLRGDFVKEIGGSREEARAQRADLKARFDVVRTNVSDFLDRIGYDPDVIANWQDKE